VFNFGIAIHLTAAPGGLVECGEDICINTLVLNDATLIPPENLPKEALQRTTSTKNPASCTNTTILLPETTIPMFPPSLHSTIVVIEKTRHPVSPPHNSRLLRARHSTPSPRAIVSGTMNPRLWLLLRLRLPSALQPQSQLRD